MSNIPTRTQLNLNAAQLDIDDEPVEFRQFIIFATSESVGIDGAPLQQIPVELVEDDEDGGALARALVAAAEQYTAADGWLIEYRNAAGVSSDDCRRLVVRLAAEHWDEYIGVDCQLCADTQVVEVCGDVEGACVTLKGDCPQCGTA
ncbi:MAG TPA: hypothetical protein VEX70_10575 [Pyrinomonadaceae bacterium]|nr:hypothetical protein [Pyrinomonadaceae bacterium]